MKELPAELRRLLYVNSVCYIVFIYIGIFVNLYIWEMHRSVREAAWYNMVLFLVWPIGFAVASMATIPILERKAQSAQRSQSIHKSGSTVAEESLIILYVGVK